MRIDKIMLQQTATDSKTSVFVHRNLKGDVQPLFTHTRYGPFVTFCLFVALKKKKTFSVVFFSRKSIIDNPTTMIYFNEKIDHV